MLGGVSDRYSARRLAPELDPAALLLEEPPIPKLSDRQTADVKRKLERDLNFGHAIRSLRDGASQIAKPCTEHQALCLSSSAQICHIKLASHLLLCRYPYVL